MSYRNISIYYIFLNIKSQSRLLLYKTSIIILQKHFPFAVNLLKKHLHKQIEVVRNEYLIIMIVMFHKYLLRVY